MDSVRSLTAVAVVTCIVGYLAYILYGRAQLQASRKAFKLKHGCQDPSSIYPGLDPFGIIWTYTIVSAAAGRRLLSWAHDSNKRLGRTFVVFGSLSNKGILTNDAENIKCALSTRFEDWSVHRLSVEDEQADEFTQGGSRLTSQGHQATSG